MPEDTDTASYVTVTHMGANKFLVTLMEWVPAEDDYRCRSVLRTCRDRPSAVEWAGRLSAMHGLEVRY